MCFLQVHGDKDSHQGVLHGGWEETELEVIYSFEFIHSANTVFIKGHTAESWGHCGEYSWAQARHSSCPHEASNPAGEPGVKQTVTVCIHSTQLQAPPSGKRSSCGKLQQTVLGSGISPGPLCKLPPPRSRLAAASSVPALASCSPRVAGSLSIRVPIAGEIESRGSSWSCLLTFFLARSLVSLYLGISFIYPCTRKKKEEEEGGTSLNQT